MLHWEKTTRPVAGFLEGKVKDEVNAEIQRSQSGNSGILVKNSQIKKC